jgi:phosphoribosylamine--glycine ligase
VKVLVIGSGGREHALAFFLKKSRLVDRLFWIPGNAGAEGLAESPQINSDDFPELVRFVKNEGIHMTVVGPEAPLVQGLFDLFSENGLLLFGPSSKGAQLEGSKIYAKKLMKDAGIPTADFSEFHDRESAQKYVKMKNPPYVIKADGLAAGKGVVIASTEKQADDVLYDMFDNKVFGMSGAKVVIEEFLNGEEATVLALCDGKTVLPLLSSQDHKPIFDGDKGPNTGGMGAISPAPVVNEMVMEHVMDRILLPLIEEISKRGIVYRGVIYAGLMISENNPSVVEFNCRFGDPEAEAVLPLLESDLCELIYLTTMGELNSYKINWKSGYCCDVVVASGGYPGAYEKGEVIEGLDQSQASEDGCIFHAGTKRKGRDIVTNGGRVLNVVGLGDTLKKAIDSAYRSVGSVSFQDMYYRRDIGFRGLKYFS